MAKPYGAVSGAKAKHEYHHLDHGGQDIAQLNQEAATAGKRVGKRRRKYVERYRRALRKGA